MALPNPLTSQRRRLVADNQPLSPISVKPKTQVLPKTLLNNSVNRHSLNPNSLSNKPTKKGISSRNEKYSTFSIHHYLKKQSPEIIDLRTSPNPPIKSLNASFTPLTTFVQSLSSQESTATVAEYAPSPRFIHTINPDPGYYQWQPSTILPYNRSSHPFDQSCSN
jgi:hypothetical protein